MFYVEVLDQRRVSCGTEFGSDQQASVDSQATAEYSLQQPEIDNRITYQTSNGRTRNQCWEVFLSNEV